MAGKQKTPHAYQRISEDIKKDRLNNFVFLYGREHYLIDWAADLIVDTYTDESTRLMDLSVYDDEHLDEEEVLTSLETLPIASARKVTIVKFYTKKAFSENTLFDHAAEVPESAVLVVALYADVKIKEGKGYNFDKIASGYDDDLLRRFVSQEIRKAGMKISGRTVNFFISESGYKNWDSEYTLYDLKNDVRKLKYYTDGDTVTENDILAVVSGDLDRNIFKLADDLVTGDKGDAIIRLRHIRGSGGTAFYVLSMICQRFEELVLVRDMNDRGYDEDSIKKIFGKSTKYVIIKKIVNRLSLKRMKEILLQAYSLEYDMKRGLLDEETALEVFIGEI